MPRAGFRQTTASGRGRLVRNMFVSALVRAGRIRGGTVVRAYSEQLVQVGKPVLLDEWQRVTEVYDRCAGSSTMTIPALDSC